MAATIIHTVRDPETKEVTDLVNTPERKAVESRLIAKDLAKLAAQGGRTEDEIFAMAPVKIRLGEESYEIPIQPWCFEKIWNRRYAEFLKRANDQKTAALRRTEGAETTNEFIDDSMWLIEEMVDLLFAYWVPDDDVKKKIEKTCSFKELQKAAEKVINIVSPLA